MRFFFKKKKGKIKMVIEMEMKPPTELQTNKKETIQIYANNKSIIE